MGQVGLGGSLVGVIGAGTMGAGIAQVAVQAGHAVAVYDAVEGAAARAVDGIWKRLESLAAKGKLSGEDLDAAKARLTAADSLEEFEDAALVIEAVIEDLDIKKKLFAQLEAIVGEECALATNTSSLSISAIAAGLKDPSRLVGMHFFNPAPLMPLVEIIDGLATAPATRDAVRGYAEAWGKTTVLCRSTPGFIVNRVARPFYAEALRAYEEQTADFATIDAVVRESGGFRMGPFELMDMIGLDVNLAVSTSVWEATGYDPRYTPAWTQKEHVAAGRLGRKSGRGFYDYAEGAEKPQPAYESEQPTADEPADQAAAIRADQATTDPADQAPSPSAWLWRALVDPSREDKPVTVAGSFRLARSFGLPATSYSDGRIIVDLALDPENAETIAIAPAEDTPERARQAAVAYFQSLGKKVIVLEDAPGLITTRTVARIVNEAVDALYRGDADEADVDTAMKLGVNYPRGPLEWGADLGFGWICEVLDNLEDVYRDGRYRPSPLLRRLGHADRLMDSGLADRRHRDIAEEVGRLLAAEPDSPSNQPPKDQS